MKKKLNLNLENKKEKGLPNIFGYIKKPKNKEEDKMAEDKNELTMMTSLYYDENKLNEKKDKKDGIKDNEEENKEKEVKKQKIELPMIDI